MTTYHIKSDKHIKKSVIFGSFTMNFNAKGIAEVEIQSEAEKLKLESVVKDYDVIHFLEDSESLQLEAEKEKNVEYLKKIISSKDDEIKVLKISNEDLASENIQLKAELKAFKTIKKDTSIDKVENIKKEVKEIEEEKGEIKEIIKEENSKEEKEDLGFSYEELNSKTVAELKDILNSVFGEFNSEWKPLTKKDDIILYIVNKVEQEKI